VETILLDLWFPNLAWYTCPSIRYKHKDKQARSSLNTVSEGENQRTFLRQQSISKEGAASQEKPQQATVLNN